MPQTCIVTDNSAQFPHPKTLGQEHIFTLSVSLHPTVSTFLQTPMMTSLSLPSHQPYPLELSPQVEQEIRHTLLSLSQSYQSILFLLSSGTILPTCQYLEDLLRQTPLPVTVDIVDSQTTGFGLGWMVQSCAAQIANGANFQDIKRYLHYQISHVYTLFYFQSLLPLKHLGILDSDQALIGDLLGIHPLVLLEKGHVLPYQKARSLKNFFDLILDYAHEFNHIHFIGIHYGSMIAPADRKNILNRMRSAFPKVVIDSQAFNHPLNVALGPQTMSVIFVERY
ncbi:MAG: DegV family protein [Chloroflexota bacterium]